MILRPRPYGRGLVVVLIVGLGLVPHVFASPAPLPLARNVDLNRMMGGWHIIATIPNGFEKGMVQPYDVYTPARKGRIREDFTMRKGGFAASAKHFRVWDWVRPDTGDAHWRVEVFWPINLPFLLLYVDPDYRWVMWGEKDRNLGWIYARDSKIPDAEYQALLARFQALGYDSARFRKFVQTPEDIGRPGFWSDGVRR